MNIDINIKISIKEVAGVSKPPSPVYSGAFEAIPAFKSKNNFGKNLVVSVVISNEKYGAFIEKGQKNEKPACRSKIR